MRRKSYKKPLILAGVLFLLMSLPTFFVESMRQKVVAMAFPFLRAVATQEEAEIQRLEAENHLLKLELAKLKVRGSESASVVTAHVIYRNPHSWGSSLWVDITGKHVEKNSPVLSGSALIGLVDCVGKSQARVRLITDSGVKPSVRAVRGSLQNVQLYEHIESVLRQLQGRFDLPLEEKEQMKLIAFLERLQDSLSLDRQSWYLAKGVLEGGGSPLWRSRNHLLKGVGFNYDFADERGPARPLTSDPPILQAHDLLVTTGLDGVFPPGLRVAEVSKVFPLKEGAYAYDNEAIPVVKNLDSIQTVFIIPSLSNESCFADRDVPR